MGAWPVVGFCGLDVLLIQLAFRLNYRDARACRGGPPHPRAPVGHPDITAAASARETGFNPYWARLEVERQPEIGVTALRIASHGVRLAVGAFLPPPERESFAAALSAALAKVRAGAGLAAPDRDLQESGGGACRPRLHRVYSARERPRWTLRS